MLFAIAIIVSIASYTPASLHLRPQMIRIPSALVAASILSGCSSNAYLSDRGHDFADIATITISTGCGAKARVGPIHTGLIGHSDLAGLRGGSFFSGQLYDHGQDFECPLPLLQMDMNRCVMSSVEDFHAHMTGEEDNPVTLRHKAYSAWNSIPLVTTEFKPSSPQLKRDTVPDAALFHPYWTQVEVAADAFAGARVGLNPGELVDFILGWVGIDFFDDDLGARKPPEPQADGK